VRQFTPCSLTIYFSLTTNQPPAISQQYFSLRTNQHQPPAKRIGCQFFGLSQKGYAAYLKILTSELNVSSFASTGFAITYPFLVGASTFSAADTDMASEKLVTPFTDQPASQIPQARSNDRKAQAHSFDSFRRRRA
jgi:hypothetical protein